MKRCSLFCAGWWPFLLFPLLLLLLFTLFQWRTVELDVVSNAQQSIDNSGQDWAKAEIFNRGREVLITGFAPSQEVRSELHQQLLSVEGVNSVTFADGIAKTVVLRDPELNVNWLDGKIVLNGELNNQASIDALVAEANMTFGAENVVNQLQSSSTVNRIAPIKGVLSNLKVLKDGAQLLIEKDEITLNGNVATNEIKTNIGAQLAKTFSGTVNNLLSAPAPVIENVRCETRLNETLATTKIVFASGKATIDQESNVLLNNIAELINNCPQAKFEVAGHTDARGNLEFNMRLSEDRAQAVVNRLTESGLDAKQFTIKGYGPSQPIADNTSEAGRAKNRRIEFNLKN